jgi:hypothetical protein
MPAEEHQPHPVDPAPSGKRGLRAAWLGSRRAGILAGVIAVGLLTGAGVAFATTGSPAHPATPATAATPAPASPPSFRMPFPHRLPFRIGPMIGGALGGPFGLGGMFGAIHGQYVAPKPGGGYQTIDFQTGKVTAVSSTSITLRSADGYTRSYAVTGSTMVNAQRGGIGSIKTGNEVSIQATVSGGTATAARIVDLSTLQQSLHRFFGNWPGKNAKVAIP